MANTLYKINDNLNSLKIAKKKIEHETRVNICITLNKFRAVPIASLFTNLIKTLHMIIIRLLYTTKLKAQNELLFLIGFYYTYH